MRRSTYGRVLAMAVGSIGPLGAAAYAACDVADARIEEAIAAKPSLREEANAQAVRDLRTLRDAAIVLETYKHTEECARLIAIVKEMAKPTKTIEASGDTDEEAADRIAESRKPKPIEKAAPKG